MLISTMSDKNSDSSPEQDKCNGRISVGQQNGTSPDDICRDYLRNVCKRGKRCRYRHPEGAEQAVNGPECIQGKKPSDQLVGQIVFCHDHQNTGCRRPQCKFVHCTREEEDYYRNTGQLPPTLLQIPAPMINGPITAPILKQAVVAELMTVKGEAPICKDFLKGECKRAGKCKYKHITNAEFDFELRRLERGPPRPVPLISRFDAPPFDHCTDLLERYDNEISLKRRRMDFDDQMDRYHNPVLQQPPSRPLTGDYKLLEEENLMLRRRIEELRKQVTDLAATNEVLLEQNARFRVAKSTAMSMPVATNPTSVVTGQVVTPTISPAPIVASSITAPRMPALHNSLVRQCIPSLQQAPAAIAAVMSTAELASQQQVIHHHQMEQIAQAAELAAASQQVAANMNAAANAETALNAANLNAASIVAATPVTLSQTILQPVAVSLASVSVQQTMPTVSMPQRSLAAAQMVAGSGAQMMSGPATAGMVSYPIMSQGHVVPRPIMSHTSCVP